LVRVYSYVCAYLPWYPSRSPQAQLTVLGSVNTHTRRTLQKKRMMRKNFAQHTHHGARSKRKLPLNTLVRRELSQNHITIYMKCTKIHNPAFSSPLHSLAVVRSFCPGWSLDSLLRSCLSALDARPHRCNPARRSVPLLRRAAVQLPAGPADGSLNPCQSTSSMYCCITSAVAVSVTVLALQELTPELFTRHSTLHICL